MIRYEISSKVITTTKRRYVKNDRCNLIWSKPSTIKVNGTPYKNTVGIDIKPEDIYTRIDIGFNDGTAIKLCLHLSDLVKITKSNSGYDIEL